VESANAYTVEFLNVCAGYLELAKQEPGRWVVVDAAQHRMLFRRI
jgi:thymidylate kinase